MMRNFETSYQLFEESKKTLTSGVSSNLRLAMKPVPVFIEEAKGARMFDVDGNEYIDYIMAYGPQILGHSNSVIVDAVQKQVEKGQTFGAQHRGEIALSKRITENVPCAELVSFSSTGSEAVQVALRLARAFTNRKKIIRFEGHYHGWIDTIFTQFGNDHDNLNSNSLKPGTSGQSISALTDVVVLPWNDIVTLEQYLIENHEDVAAIISEPFMCNSGCISPLPGYMERVRELSSELGIVLIFDEVITGFRLGLGGAQKRLGITPDLVTLGKAVAGGLPLSAVAGKKDIMSLIASGKVNHMGTLNGNPLCTASAIAGIDYLSKNDGEVYKTMEKQTDKLISNFQLIAKKYKVPLLINRVGSVFHTMFIDLTEVTKFEEFEKRDSELFAQFAEYLLQEGITVRPSGLWYLSTAHTEKDIEETIDAVDKAFQSLVYNNVIKNF